MLDQATWISSPIPTNEHRLYRFRKEFSVTDPHDICAAICADSRYKLYINHHYVCEGPCIGTLLYYDFIHLDQYLEAGKNLFEVEVLYLGGLQGASCIQRKNRVALAFEAFQGSYHLFSTDSTWDCALDYSHEFYLAPRMHANGYLNQKYQKRELQWQDAIELPQGQGILEWGVLPRFDAKPRPLQMYTPFSPVDMQISKSSSIHPRRIHQGQQESLVFELTKNSVGYPEFTFHGTGKVVITYSESYEHYNAQLTRFEKQLRTDPTGVINGVSDILELTEPQTTYRPFFAKTARYIMLEIEAQTDVEIAQAIFSEYRYPLPIMNHFSCSDDTYNQIFQVSINTLENCMLDTYVDCPYYEMQQYTEDAYLEMMYTFMLSDDYSLPKKVLMDLWQSQNSEGMQLAAAPMEYRQITPTFCFFWIMMLDQYLLYTGDAETIKPMLSGVYAILSWFNNYINEEGVVGVYDYGKFIDWVSTWKRGMHVDGAMEKPTSIASLMYLYALRIGSKLFNRFGRPGIASDLSKEYEHVKEAVNQIFFDSHDGMYRDTIDGRYSEHSQIWAVLSGAIEGKDAQRAIQGCERADVHKCSYSYRFFKNRAFEACGLAFDMDHFLADWKTMLALNASTWFESPGDARSDCHAWSSVPLYEFTTRILGVTPLKEGFKAVRIAPSFGKLNNAAGTVPTPMGGITVHWSKTDDTYDIHVTGPVGVEKRLFINNECVCTTTESSICYCHSLLQCSGS